MSKSSYFIAAIAGGLSFILGSGASADVEQKDLKILNRPKCEVGDFGPGTNHQIQIIDERPLTQDFREAPTSPQVIPLLSAPGTTDKAIADDSKIRQRKAYQEAAQPPLVSREQLETTYFNSVKESIATWWNSSARPVQAPVIRFDLSANGKVSGVVVSETSSTKISANGKVSGVKVSGTSGSKSTDAACIKALKNMQFDPFPERMTPKSGRPLELRVNMETGELVPSLYSRYHPARGIPWTKLILSPESPLELPDRGGKDRF